MLRKWDTKIGSIVDGCNVPCMQGERGLTSLKITSARVILHKKRSVMLRAKNATMVALSFMCSRTNRLTILQVDSRAHAMQCVLTPGKFSMKHDAIGLLQVHGTTQRVEGRES